MIDQFYWLGEGWRMFKRARRVRKHGFNKHVGSPEEIAKLCVKDCWNGELYRTSTGNFAQFWSRDFGMCVNGLLMLGEDKKVVTTLHYALSKMKTASRITTQITPNGVPIDFPRYGADSLPWLIHAIHAYTEKTKNRSLLDYYEPMLKEALDYYESLFDKENHLLRQDAKVAILRDHYKLESPTYANILAWYMQTLLKELKIEHSFNKIPIKRAIKKHLWNGKFFEEDLRKPGLITGDGNAIALYTQFLNKKEGLKLIEVLQKEKLDSPFPLKYYKVSREKHIHWLLKKLTPNYEGDTVWGHLGLCYIEGVSHYNKTLAKRYAAQYAEKIEENGTFLEVYNPDGTPYMNKLFACDESMLWAAQWLFLNKNH